MKKLLAIDGNSIMNRAFYGIRWYLYKCDIWFFNNFIKNDKR